jgi:hypothetical protein
METFDDLHDADKIRAENEIRKMKMTLESGADFYIDPDMKIDPDVERNWLDQIEKFEDAHRNATIVQVLDFIGNPVYRLHEELSDSEVSRELQDILELLSRKGIEIDTIYEVEDRELYRFITQELFFHEIDDIHIEGMTCHFIYEEFHPNHLNDVKSDCIDLVKNIFNKEYSFNPKYVNFDNKLITRANEPVSKEEAIRRIDLFRDAYTELNFEEIDFQTVLIDTERAVVICRIKYSATEAGTNKRMHMNGTGSFEMKLIFDMWHFYRIDIPGGPI